MQSSLVSHRILRVWGPLIWRLRLHCCAVYAVDLLYAPVASGRDSEMQKETKAMWQSMFNVHRRILVLPVLIRTARMALLASLTAGARRRGQQDSGESSSVGASVRRSWSAASLESASAASAGSHSARRSCSSGALGARFGGVSVESDRGSQGQGEGLDDSGSDF